MRSWTGCGAALLLVGALALSGCGQSNPAPSPGASSSGAPSPAGRVSSASSPATTVVPHSGTPTPAAPSALGQLMPFIAVAGQADGQLRHAASLVNAGITSTSMYFSRATLDAVRDLSAAPAGRAIPAGLPAALLRAVLVVYGDLDSRAAAFGGVLTYGSSGTMAIGSPDARNVLTGLRHGAPAAASFGADLAAVRTLAGQSAPVTIARPESRAAAGLAVRLATIDRHNFCSDLFGGWVPTALATIRWDESASRARHCEGMIDDIGFDADYSAAHGWQADIHAC